MNAFLEDIDTLGGLLGGMRWALSGSGALYIRGIDTTVGDIDIDVHRSIGGKVGRVLSGYEPEQSRNGVGYRSLNFQLNHPIEITLLPYEFEPEIVTFGERVLLAEPLSLLRQLYARMERDDKVALIDTHTGR